MDVLANGFGLCHRANHALAEVVGMRAGETKPPHARETTDRSQQVGEIMLAVEIRIHRLAYENDLRDPRCDYGFRLPDDFVKLPASLGTARRRHDAVRALVITPALDGNPRLHALEPARREILVVLF